MILAAVAERLVCGVLAFYVKKCLYVIKTHMHFHKNLAFIFSALTTSILSLKISS